MMQFIGKYSWGNNLKNQRLKQIVSLVLAFSMTDFAKAYKYRVLLYKTVSTLAGLKNKITSTVCRGNVGTAPQTRGSSQQKKDRHY